MAARSQLARQLQAYCLLLAAAAVAWLVWRWPTAPGQALAGAALVVLGGPIVLGLELVILRIVDAAAGLPRPTPGQLLKAWISESLHFYRTFCWRQPFRWRSIADRLEGGGGTTGVVLVHGFFCNRGFWSPWLRRLEKLVRPRMTAFLDNRIALSFTGLLLVLLGVLLALPIPFTNYVFGFLLLLFAFALLERDGALLLVAWIAGSIAVVVFGFLSGNLVEATTALLARWF